MKYVFILGAVMFAGAGAAYAADTAELREAVTCKPVENIVKFMQKIDDIPKDDSTVIITKVGAQIKAADGGEMPLRVYSKVGDQETPLLIDPAGTIENFDRLMAMPEETQMCIEDPARAGTPSDEPGLTFSLSTDTEYSETTGRHSLEQLRLGSKEGKTHYKTVYGGGIRNAFIPDINHVLIAPVEGQPLPKIFVEKDGAPIDVKIEEVGYELDRFHVVSVKDMRKAEADFLVVEGPYTLQPVPSVKKLRSFGMID